MKIVLIDKSFEMCEEWDSLFKQKADIKNGTLSSVMKKDKTIDTIVSPGNSFCQMDGGYDLAVAEYIGKKGVELIKKKINNIYNGILPPGNTISVNLEDKKIIYIPTMYVPNEIYDYGIVFTCMYNALLEAKRMKSVKVLIPAFGSGTGNIPKNIIAKNMLLAYNYFNGSINNQYVSNNIILN